MPEGARRRKDLKGNMTEIRDVYSRITGKIVADLERVGPALGKAMERGTRRGQDHTAVAS
jgi:hypothetical protein